MAKRIQRRSALRKPKAESARQKADIVPSHNHNRQKIHSLWHKDFQLLRDFRRRKNGKWPSRDSKNPAEIRLANWIRSNVELLTADRLPPEQARMINALMTGTKNRA